MRNRTHSKLNPHQRQEALKRIAAGETYMAIARSYAVDPNTIARWTKLAPDGSKSLPMHLVAKLPQVASAAQTAPTASVSYDDAMCGDPCGASPPSAMWWSRPRRAVVTTARGNSTHRTSRSATCLSGILPKDAAQVRLAGANPRKGLIVSAPFVVEIVVRHPPLPSAGKPQARGPATAWGPGRILAAIGTNSRK